MTLTSFVLDTIKSNWSGGFPSDIERLNVDDSENLAQAVRTTVQRFSDATVIGATRVSGEDVPFGVQSDPAQSFVVRVRIAGAHTDEFGQVSDAADFEDNIVQEAKAALRTERYSPAVGADHPATFVRLFIENESAQSGLNKDLYATEFDVRLEGHL